MSNLKRLEHRVATGRNIVAEQRRRVERQQALVSDLEENGRHNRTVRDGRELLTQMIRNLDVMLGNLHRIEAERIAASSRLDTAAIEDSYAEA
jgi:uncharacterized coiled-coil protein SlyX